MPPSMDAALASYLPDMQRSVETHFKTWLTMGEFGWLDQMRALAFEVICSNMLGLGRGPELGSPAEGLQSHYRRDAGTAPPHTGDYLLEGAEM